MRAAAKGEVKHGMAEYARGELRAGAPARWRPLSPAALLRQRGWRDRDLQVVFGWWLLLTAVSIAGGLLVPTKMLNDWPVTLGPFRFYVSVFPPVTVSLILLFWLGFEWAAVQIYLATLCVAVHEGFTSPLVLIYSLADVLGLAVYSVAYRLVRVPWDQRSWVSVLWFGGVSFLAALASSAGSFVFAQATHRTALETFAAWQGWWSGVMLQVIVLAGPVFFLLARPLESWKESRFRLDDPPPPALRNIAAAVMVAGALLVGFVLASGTLAERRLEAALTGGVIPEVTRAAITDAARSMELATWSAAMLVVALALAGVFLASYWTRALQAEVTERTRDVHESEQRFRAAFEQAAVGIAEIASDGRVLRANHKLADLLGYRTEEVEGRHLDEFLHPEDPGAGFERRYRTRNHSTVWAEQTVSLVRDAAGEAKYELAIVADVSGRKRLEEQLRHAQKMEAIGRLAGGVAHDFNNVLTAILGYCDLALLRVTPETAARRQLSEIERAAERGASLTRQLLAFSRRQVLRPRQLHLNTLVAGMETMLRRLLGARVDLAIEPDSELGFVLADSTQLDQVVMNLAVNAADAMPAGGRLTIQTANVRAGAELGLPPGDYVELTVRDTGVGMDAATLSHVFEPFFTTKEQGKGTGLGLSMVYGIVQQSGGVVAASSQPGAGSEFRVLLPRVAGPVSAEEPAVSAAPAPGGTETVLAVDDDPAVRRLIGEILRDHGYRVLEAEDEADADRLAGTFAGPIDLLVTDVEMPGVSGRDLARRLRIRRPELKVLFASGYGEPGTTPDSPLLTKPFTPDELARSVREALRT